MRRGSFVQSTGKWDTGVPNHPRTRRENVIMLFFIRPVIGVTPAHAGKILFITSHIYYTLVHT